jgi:hypothetical protein
VIRRAAVQRSEVAGRTRCTAVVDGAALYVGKGSDPVYHRIALKGGSTKADPFCSRKRFAPALVVMISVPAVSRIALFGMTLLSRAIFAGGRWIAN